jgi:SAM-dependent methyltransferase
MSPPDRPPFATQEQWDDRYRSASRIWSGRPNPHLVTEVADLAPGTALDAGSGEGADAIWLAARGWLVTALDISPVALERAAAHAAEAGPAVAERITWRHTDLTAGKPDSGLGTFDLVTVHFLHLPADELDELHRRLAAAVAPGGTLLVVGHHPSDLATGVRRPRHPGMLFTPERVAEVLEPGAWDVVRADVRGREAPGPDGGPPVTVRDSVLRAVRRPAARRR